MSTIDSLSLFVVVYRHGNFTAASRVVGLDPSVVSRRIRGLEKRLGTALFHRSTRALTPTQAAVTFYERVAPALQEIDEARLEVGAQEGVLRGRLRISAPGALGRVRIGPVAHAFALAHPQVTLELRFSDQRLDLVREGIDLAIRVGLPADQTQVVRRLGVSEQWVVASPAYLARHPITADMAGHRLILRMQSGRLIDPRDALDPGARENIGVAMITDDISAAADAAVAGVGVGALPRWLVEADVAAGRLRQLPVGPPDFAVDVYAVLVLGRRSTARCRAFLEAVLASF